MEQSTQADYRLGINGNRASVFARFEQFGRSRESAAMHDLHEICSRPLVKVDDFAKFLLEVRFVNRTQASLDLTN